MHDIEPWWGWRDEYSAEEDKKSPFHGRKYSEFSFSNKVYNYLIHPQWDYFGSETLYAKILFVDYRLHFAIIELIGEWNDALYNDIMFLKTKLVDRMTDHKISKFVIICENVMNFHGEDDCYYEEWYDDIKDDRGWICLLNTYEHVSVEMQKHRLHYYINVGEPYNNINWRGQKPIYTIQALDKMINKSYKQLT